MILVSCESHEQNTDNAFEQVKEEKMISNENDSDSVIKEIIEEPKKLESAMKNENPDEWTKFKIETEKKIRANENKIKEIKGIPNADSKLLRTIISLEKDNNDLRKQMDEYYEEMKVKWENFKTKINHNINEIGIQLKDIKINNKI
ncbi:MAG: hypothetical protein A3F72_05775 [Bacteroidetes bacterium RIFCSPLOWO2_12_FULL_35_15]|nr:MAG: hypothetical protein A3F72_05775 [Bacteroidetes bacterium RIFCSPLOWO2_12_FULL_35_15]